MPDAQASMALISSLQQLQGQTCKPRLFSAVASADNQSQQQTVSPVTRPMPVSCDKSIKHGSKRTKGQKQKKSPLLRVAKDINTNADEELASAARTATSLKNSALPPENER